MKKLLVIGVFFLLAACTNQTKNDSPHEVASFTTNLVEKQNLDHWSLSLIPHNSNNNWRYDVKAQYTGSGFLNSVVLKISSNSKVTNSVNVTVSRLDSGEEITFPDLAFPIDYPLQVNLTWAEGSDVYNGYGKFQISKIK